MMHFIMGIEWYWADANVRGCLSDVGFLKTDLPQPWHKIISLTIGVSILIFYEEKLSCFATTSMVLFWDELES